MDPINSGSYFNYDLLNQPTDALVEKQEVEKEATTTLVEDTSKPNSKELPRSLIARRYEEFIARLSNKTGLSPNDLEELLLWVEGLSDHEAKTIAEMMKTKYGKEKQTENQELKASINTNKLWAFAFGVAAIKASQSVATISPMYARAQFSLFNTAIDKSGFAYLQNLKAMIPDAHALAGDELTKQMRGLAFRDSQAHEYFSAVLSSLKECFIAGDNAESEVHRTTKDSIKQVEDNLGNDSAEAARKRDSNFSKVGDIREKLYRLIQQILSGR
jgi:hypothetical protein